MFTRPDDVSDAQVVAALASGWSVDATQLSYAAVGYGAHHWIADADDTRWFLTVDDLDARRTSTTDTTSAAQGRLVAALATAAELHRGGLGFVVAPLAKPDGELVHPIEGRYVLSVFPFAVGTPGPWGPFDTQAERFAVVDRLAELHAATDRVAGIAQTDDLTIPVRDGLHEAIDQTGTPWSTGPFADPARRLLATHSAELRTALMRYDDLVGAIDTTALAITHGEPHRGNVLFGPDGPALVDWDTVRLAPVERDLWSLVAEDAAVAAHYEQASGRTLNPTTMTLYRLWWDLCEVSLYIADFRAPHADTEDTRVGWESLQRHLDPTRWDIG